MNATMFRMAMTGVVGMGALMCAGTPAWAGEARDFQEGTNMRERQEVPSVVVSGRGEVSAKPDRAVVNTGVSVQEPTAEAAMRRCGQLMQSVVETITKQGVADERVQTARVSLSPVYDQSRNMPEGKEPRIVGYRAENTVRVQIEDLTKIGPVLDAVVKAGANQSFGISFQLKEDKAARAQALRDACTDARAKAAIIAESLGMLLGELIEVNEGGVQVVQPRPMGGYSRMMAAEGSFGGTPVSPGEISVEASVTIRYALIKK
jgi:uncharacterized protein